MAELNSVKELAAYIQKKYFDEKQKQISPIKLQKYLYFLIAYWGGLVRKSKEFSNCAEEDFSSYSEYLFDEEIEAWVYGPVVPCVYCEENLSSFYNENIFDGKEKLKEFIDNLLEELFDANDFALVELSHKDNSWISKFNYSSEKHNNVINKEEVIAEYSRK